MSNADVCGIHKFVERDIDMLLAEELRVSPLFAKWVMTKFGMEEFLVFPG